MVMEPFKAQTAVLSGHHQTKRKIQISFSSGSDIGRIESGFMQNEIVDVPTFRIYRTQLK
jgi:hypothetical protein